MGKSFHGTTYAQAEAFLLGGRAKTYRPAGNNRYLTRQADGAISFVLHDTAVVTYCADGTYVLNTGGWHTVTTLKTINGATPFRIGSTYSRKFPGWGIGFTGEVSAPRVQKCRTCHGAGGTVDRAQCWGAPSWPSSLRCNGATTHYALPHPGYGDHDAWDTYAASAYSVPCEHGRIGRHALSTCEHGRTERHPYGEIRAHECGRCHGAGVADYGSEPVPIVWTGAPVRMSADGNAMLDADAPHYPATKSYAPKSSGWYAPHVAHYAAPVEQTPTVSGDTITTALSALLPALATVTKCPATSCDMGQVDTITNLIVHLNDSHKWTREAVADWLDTLDTDLRFPALA